jgi:hypothetical protein
MRKAYVHISLQSYGNNSLHMPVLYRRPEYASCCYIKIVRIHAHEHYKYCKIINIHMTIFNYIRDYVTKCNILTYDIYFIHVFILYGSSINRATLLFYFCFVICFACRCFDLHSLTSKIIFVHLTRK